VTVVRDPVLGVHTSVLPCRSCNRLVYFSLSEKGRRTPFEVDADGKPTRINHFATCPDAKVWRKKR